MARLPELTEVEIRQWFVLSKYASAKLPMAPDAWVPIVAARAHLLRLLEMGELAEAMAGHQKLADDPTVDLGVQPDFLAVPDRKLPVSDPADTPSVKLISMRSVRGMHRMETVAAAFRTAETKAFDRIFSEVNHHGRPGGFAHLQVNLLATKVQIQRDFARWLDLYVASHRATNRIYEPDLMKKWAKDKILPYADLYIFAAASGGRIGPTLFCKLLGYESSPGHAWDELRAHQRALHEVFTFETASALRLARDSAK